jgi:hypothetical protein
MFEKIKQMKERCDIASYRTKKKVQIAAAGTGVTAAVAAPASVLAENADASSILSSIIGIVLGIARYVGIALLVYAIYQMIMAMKDDNADSKSRAMQLIVVSIVLIILKTIIAQINIFGNYTTEKTSDQFGVSGS